MSDLSTRLQLPLVQPAQAQKHVTVNEAILLLDLLAQCVVQSAATQSQPATPVDSVVYILRPGKTGAAWGAMADHALAAYQDGVWREITPKPGWAALVLEQGETLIFENSRWRESRARPTSPSRRNVLINGTLGLWRRGDTITHTGSGRTFGPDGFFVDSSDPAASLTLSRVAITTGGPGGARFALRIACSARPAGAVLRLVQRVEDVATFAGGPAVFSLWTRASKTLTQMSVAWTQRFGAGGSAAVASPEIILTAQPTTSWARTAASVDLAGVIGKTIATGGNLEAALNLSALSAGDWIEIALPQLEQGRSPTPFDWSRPDADLAEASRRLQIIGREAFGRWVSATQCDLGWSYPVEMLAPPTLTLITQTPAIGEYFVSGRVGVASQLQAPFSGVRGGQTRISGFSGATPGNSALSDTENLIRAEAEL